MNIVPEKLINFRVFNESNDLIGVADVDLPSLDAMTETVKGAGILGEIESPVLGHYGSMTLTINWRTVTLHAAELSVPKTHQLDLRGAIQVHDAGTGKYTSMALKVVCGAIPKKTGLGKLDVGAAGDVANEFEVIHIRVWLDGKEQIQIDKLNGVCKINGEDVLAKVKADLGLV
ncbi:phage major tail tube protein [Aminobacterium sp. UBA5514]|uniref:phage major tail tube protein n=1 Tax=Aminobacterium sp. UBA5514 TaxID=1946036 RepID=UPI00257FB128|nr:phage major tail tube protein [Aminobacterium sp. UBA5514]